MRSPGIPAVSAMPAPHFKRSYGTATKVTEKLIEPPRFRLTRSLMLPLARWRRRSRTIASQSRVCMFDAR